MALSKRQSSASSHSITRKDNRKVFTTAQTRGSASRKGHCRFSRCINVSWGHSLQESSLESSRIELRIEGGAENPNHQKIKDRRGERTKFGYLQTDLEAALLPRGTSPQLARCKNN